MIRVSTGITPGYQDRADAWLKSAHILNVPVTVFGTDYPRETTKIGGHEAIPCDYSTVTQLPKMMLQNGALTRFAPDWWDLDVVIFVDADAVWQRPFTDAELDLFRSVSLGEMMAGYNLANGRQTLAEEAARLQPKIALDEIVRRFPYCDHMECRNFGFVVADFATWKQLYAAFNAIWDKVDQCFHNPAKVQWCALYALQSTPGMKLLDLPDSTHGHGHCGRRAGLEKGADGLWRQDGVVVAFAHCL